MVRCTCPPVLPHEKVFNSNTSGPSIPASLTAYYHETRSLSPQRPPGQTNIELTENGGYSQATSQGLSKREGHEDAGHGDDDEIDDDQEPGKGGLNAREDVPNTHDRVSGSSPGQASSEKNVVDSGGRSTPYPGVAAIDFAATSPNRRKAATERATGHRRNAVLSLALRRKLGSFLTKRFPCHNGKAPQTRAEFYEFKRMAMRKQRLRQNRWMERRAAAPVESSSRASTVSSLSHPWAFSRPSSSRPPLPASTSQPAEHRGQQQPLIEATPAAVDPYSAHGYLGEEQQSDQATGATVTAHDPSSSSGSGPGTAAYGSYRARAGLTEEDLRERRRARVWVRPAANEQGLGPDDDEDIPYVVEDHSRTRRSSSSSPL